MLNYIILLRSSTSCAVFKLPSSLIFLVTHQFHRLTLLKEPALAQATGNLYIIVLYKTLQSTDKRYHICYLVIVPNHCFHYVLCFKHIKTDDPVVITLTGSILSCKKLVSKIWNSYQPKTIKLKYFCWHFNSTVQVRLASASKC